MAETPAEVYQFRLQVTGLLHDLAIAGELLEEAALDVKTTTLASRCWEMATSIRTTRKTASDRFSDQRGLRRREAEMSSPIDVSESSGVFSEEIQSARTCRKCGSKNVTCRVWSSSCGGYEDEKYTCRDCGAVQWVEGADS